MSTKIYDAFIVNSDKRSSVKACVALANHSKEQAMKQFVDSFSKAVLVRMFEAVDLVKFYGENIMELDKFQKGYIKDLLEDYIDIRRRYSSMSEMNQLEFFWTWAAKNMTDSLRYLEQKFHSESHHKAKLVFIPCDNKMLVMYFGDPTYRHIISDDTAHYLDYHYQNQCDKPDDVSDEEWKQRETDWDKAIGPDYIPANHGLLFTILDYDDLNVSFAIDTNFKNAYATKDEIADQRIENIFETIECPLMKNTETLPLSDITAAVTTLTSTEEYKAWKATTIAEIKAKIGIDSENNVN
jgi:hypothetical protein